MSRYLIHFLLAFVSIAIAMLSFNWFADPYAIFHTASREGQTAQQPALILNERIFKTVGLARQKSDVIFLGTSRTDIGIGPEHQSFSAKRVVNLATFGQPIRESQRLMQLAVQYAEPKTIIIGLDFFAFNALFPSPSDFSEENFDASRRLKLAFSISTSVDAWKLLRRKTADSGDCCDLNGFRTAQDTRQFVGNYRQRFASNEQSYLMEKYLPFPECAYAYTSPKARTTSTLDEFRTMVRLAHQHGIDLRFFIPPSHARQWETLAAAGLWEKWEEWKRLVVRTNEDEAQHAGHSAFPLWDFSGYDTISSEAVPVAGDTTLMRWYTDSAHFTPAAGELVLDRMFGVNVAKRKITDDFGVQLTSANLDAHLETIRAARQHYRETHAKDIAEIAAMAREVELSKHCPKSP